MKVNRINEIKGTKRDVLFTGGNSQRVVLEKDGLGFAMMKTNIKKGGPYHWHYPYHSEACYCISGEGILRSLDDDSEYIINVDSCYLLDNHDNHTFEALTDVVLISVFNPPLTGDESHDENGNYQLSDFSKRERAIKIVESVNNSHSEYDAIEIVETLIK